MNAKKLARRFCRQVKNTTPESLEQYLLAHGWRIIVYDDENEEAVRLLKRMNLYEFAQNQTAFSVESTEIAAVFIKSGLSDESRRQKLLHEIGHIQWHHELGSVTDAEEEQASLFVKECLVYNAYRFWLRPFTIILIAVAAVVCGLAVGMWLRGVSAEGTVAVTQAGERYHLTDCYYIHGKDKILISPDEARALGKIPCAVCRPDD